MFFCSQLQECDYYKLNGENLDCYKTECYRNFHFLCLVEESGLIMQCGTSTFCHLHRDKLIDREGSEAVAHLEIADDPAIVGEMDETSPAVDENGTDTVAQR